MNNEPKAISHVRGRQYIIDHYEQENGLQFCVMQPSIKHPDDIAEMWTGEGETLGEAVMNAAADFAKTRENPPIGP